MDEEMLPTETPSETRPRSPEVQYLLERSTKKSKLGMLQRQDQGMSLTPDCVPETPFSPPLAPKVQTEAPVAQIKPDGRGDQITLSPYTKPVRTSERKVYTNQLYNSRFGPLEDLDVEELDSPQAQTPREATKKVIPRISEAIVNQPNKNQQMRVPVGSQGNYRGRGGRTNTPRRATTEEEHMVVRGSLRGKVVSKEVVQHQLRPPDQTPSH
nr:uncharacterized protein LOC109179535 isoform X2 [Ipomoea trifida]GMD04025.1 uncharacterized protein LOC109179535 isoform X2 [Ipomoea batatas]